MQISVEVSATTVGMAEEYEGRCKEGVKMFSPRYYGVCAIRGMLSAGAIHLAINSLDALKVNMQILHSVLSRLSKFVCKLNLTMLKAWSMAFQNCMQLMAYQVSILMFSTFEHTVDLLYHNVIQRKRRIVQDGNSLLSHAQLAI